MKDDGQASSDTLRSYVVGSCESLSTAATFGRPRPSNRWYSLIMDDDSPPTTNRRQPSLDEFACVCDTQMEVKFSARRHGIGETDIRHAWNNAIRLIEYEYRGEERILVIGPDRHGMLLEMVALPVASPARNSTTT